MIVVTAIAETLAGSQYRLDFPELNDAQAAPENERVLQRGTATLRVHVSDMEAGPPAVLLPLDKLFEIRAEAALQLWRALCDRNPGPNPAALSPQRRARFLLALRALDARLENASYREIAEVLFHPDRMSARSWKTHDLRSQTIRIARLGFDLMEGGYRNLLLYPYRRRP